MRNYLSIITIAILATAFVSCSKEKDPEGSVISHSDCKEFQEPLKYTTDNDETCIEYTYSATAEILNITHVNAGFNCCPGVISANAYFEGDTLIIRENETAPLCGCNCLFDLQIEVKNIESGVYFIKVFEPYLGTQEPLEFEINLSESTQGSYCVVRNQYPWGVE